MSIKLRVLITVKTYPLPSVGHQELVCTAGVTETGDFVRLYPINYRYRPYYELYSKYQWIEVEAERNPKDKRPESYRPLGDIKLVGKPLKTENFWEERKKYVFGQGVQTMCQLNRLDQTEKSLGIVKLRELKKFDIEETDREWKSEWRGMFEQARLFGQQKPLEKIPYTYRYEFLCEDPACKGHKMMNEDWEIGEYYRKFRDKHKDEALANEEVRKRFVGVLCGPDVDTHFFVGTVAKWGTWVILGIFWPKKNPQPKLW